ncbi:MAG: ABC transporter ATP-binding protein [Colwellia sp.]
MSALSITQLSCYYQKNQVLDNLDLVLEDNEIICLLGESGCGKTTLLRAVSGLQESLNGRITIQNETVNDVNTFAPPENRKVGYIFQDYALFPHLSVFDNIAFSLVSLNKTEKSARVNEALELVQLTEFSERFPHQLSGGQQQRIAIARALAYQPQLMLLDEPFSNLDQHVRLSLIHQIRTLFKSREMSALFVTHSKEEGFAFADRIALMHKGKIIQIDTPEKLYNSPKTPYVADFMGKSNYINIEVINSSQFQSCFGLIESNTTLHGETGTKAQLLLRPEQIKIEADPQGKAVISRVDFQGASLQLSVSFSGYELLIQQTNTPEIISQLSVGNSVKLSIFPHSFITFPLHS